MCRRDGVRTALRTREGQNKARERLHQIARAFGRSLNPSPRKGRSCAERCADRKSDQRNRRRERDRTKLGGGDQREEIHPRFPAPERAREGG